MGAHVSRLFSALYDPFMQRTEVACLSAWRRDLLALARGDVLEIGAGTGANLPFYTGAVERLWLSEPDPHMRARLARRASTEAPAPTTLAARGEALPFADASLDTVVATLVLCSVPDAMIVLAEVRRVLRPGGSLIFLEHVAADERPRRLAWQRRVEPFWRLVSGDCHLTRRSGDAIRGAGFAVEGEVRESMRKALPFLRSTVRGVARKPLWA